MMYCLEIDLACSSKARDIYYEILKLPNDKRERKILLTENHKAIKKRENILQVISKLQLSNYPESLKKIKNAIIKDITD